MSSARDRIRARAMSTHRTRAPRLPTGAAAGGEVSSDRRQTDDRKFGVVMEGNAGVRAHHQRATLMVSVSQRPKALPSNGPDTRQLGFGRWASVGPPHALSAALVHPPMLLVV